MELENLVWETGAVKLDCVLCDRASEFIATLFIPEKEPPLPVKVALCRRCANLYEGTIVRMLTEGKRFSGGIEAI